MVGKRKENPDMHEVYIFAVGTGSKIGEFRFPRIPVKGDVLDIPTFGLYEVVRVTLYSPGLYDANPPMVQVKICDFDINPQ
jgi:hypothetical protein